MLQRNVYHIKILINKKIIYHFISVKTQILKSFYSINYSKNIRQKNN